jgi:hypothetical protein
MMESGNLNDGKRQRAKNGMIERGKEAKMK